MVAEHPRDRILFVLSQPYFSACTDDLERALATARDAQVSIVAAGVAANPRLAGWQLPANARLQDRLGGTRGALNVRIASALLNAGLTDHAAMHRYLTRSLAKAPSLTVYARSRLSDAAVSAFIRTHHAQDSTVSRTGLLRQLRDAGMACEQNRFAAIHAATVGGTS
ncbi:hypothetical protein M6D93_15235 [Jatrophihabitans telluris]|uniref:Uncharacterized protein n=1 Tax=Jatrophihabitans telluris TaxID=2038343 RepID=A0ABY4QWF2_9ACTN|nr:hypothetical protein [Jatrophihabitans telluris]UQX87644.1 hypothetical protein M6D93_15235 [Jatrophihabitans telluris]